MDSDRYLCIEGIGMTFETRKGDFVALERIDLTGKKGEFVLFVRPFLSAS